LIAIRIWNYPNLKMKSLSNSRVGAFNDIKYIDLISRRRRNIGNGGAKLAEKLKTQ